jgi:hypothetical protein
MDVNIPAFLPGDIFGAVQEHLQARQALISQEKKYRSGQQ